jgi:hypothetical protein
MSLEVPNVAGLANGRKRRNLVIPARSGEGPLAEPTTAIRRRQRDRRLHLDRRLSRLGLPDYSRTRNKPPQGRLDRGNGTEGGQGFGEVLESLARRRLGPSQEKARSTTQCFSAAVFCARCLPRSHDPLAAAAGVVRRASAAPL